MTPGIWSGTVNQRLWRRTFWIVIIATVAGGVFGALPFQHHHGLALDVVAMTLIFGGYAGSFSLFPARFGATDDLRLPVAGVYRDRRRAITRTALGRKDGNPADLSADERRRALDYAQAFSVNQPVVLAQTVLLFAGLIGTQLLSRDDHDTWETWIRIAYLTAVPAFLVVMTVLTLLWVRRATAYAEKQSGPVSTTGACADPDALSD